MVSKLLHPRMVASLQKNFFPQACTIQINEPTQTPSGKEQPHWVDIPGLVAIPCKVGGTTGGEHRMTEQIYLDATNIILLAGFFAQIDETMRAVVEGQDYDILLVNSNSEKAVMRLVTRIVL